MNDVPKPLNSEERYLHAMVVRLDALCHMVSSLMEYIADKEDVAVTNNEVVEQVEVEPVEEEVEVVDTQCIGITARGSRCKRDAQEGSKFCNMHEPEEE